jgi:hypothetical protein
VIVGVVNGEDPLMGDYYVEQTLPGGCSDVNGQYSVTLPADLTPAMPTLRLLVVPANTFTGARLISAAGPYDLALDNATGTASGYVTQSGQALANAVVELQDSEGAVIGAAVSSKTGLWQAGVATASGVQASAHPLGVIGSNLSADLIAAATHEEQAGPGVDAVYPSLDIPDTATVTGRVMVQGSNPHPWQAVHADCVALCTSSLIGMTDDSGNFSMSFPAGASMIVGYGGQLLQRSFELGTSNLGSTRTVPSGGKEIDYQQAPATWFASQSALSLSRAVTWTWTGGSLESAPYEFKHSRSKATWHSAKSPYSDWTTDRSGTDSATVPFGGTQCDRVLTITALHGVSATTQGASAVQCISVPLDERSLAASKGWHKYSSSSAFNRTLLTATQAKATLTLNGVTGHRVAVVYGRSAHGGNFTISVNGKVVRSVSTVGKGANRLIAYAPVSAIRNAKIVVATTNAKSVSIDGLAVLP